MRRLARGGSGQTECLNGGSHCPARGGAVVFAGKETCKPAHGGCRESGRQTSRAAMGEGSDTRPVEWSQRTALGRGANVGRQVKVPKPIRRRTAEDPPEPGGGARWLSCGEGAPEDECREREPGVVGWTELRSGRRRQRSSETYHRHGDNPLGARGPRRCALHADCLHLWAVLRLCARLFRGYPAIHSSTF